MGEIIITRFATKLSVALMIAVTLGSAWPGVHELRCGGGRKEKTDNENLEIVLLRCKPARHPDAAARISASREPAVNNHLDVVNIRDLNAVHSACLAPRLAALIQITWLLFQVPLPVSRTESSGETETRLSAHPRPQIKESHASTTCSVQNLESASLINKYL